MAFRKGVTIVSDNKQAIRVFNELGSTVVSRSDDEFAALQAVTCVMGHFYETLNTSGEWLCQHGVESDAAAKYITEFYKTVLAEAVDRAQ